MDISYEEIVEESIECSEPVLVFSVHSKEAQTLIGRDGDVFRALNHVVSRMVAQKYEDVPRFQIDVDDFYKKQIESIKQKAIFAGERVRSFKASVDMEPMNAFERMIVHSVFTDQDDIKTHSEGDGRDRRVVLSYVENTI